VADNTHRAGRFKRWYDWLAAYFKAAIDPALTRRVRIFRVAQGLAVLGALGLALLCAYSIMLIPFTPSISDLRKAKIDQPTVLVSADGRRLATLKPMNREWVRLDQIAPHVINALIATEDHRFYQHFGIDLLRTVTGVLRTVIGDPEGGSTLTQQLARNLYPEEIGRRRTLPRKIKETITRSRSSTPTPKKKSWKPTSTPCRSCTTPFGIEMAARTYFDKPARKLTLLESATLIAMLKGTKLL
jgi:penicillin-binding protein 1A